MASVARRGLTGSACHRPSTNHAVSELFPVRRDGNEEKEHVGSGAVDAPVFVYPAIVFVGEGGGDVAVVLLGTIGEKDPAVDDLGRLRLGKQAHLEMEVHIVDDLTRKW